MTETYCTQCGEAVCEHLTKDGLRDIIRDLKAERDEALALLRRWLEPRKPRMGPFQELWGDTDVFLRGIDDAS